MLEAAAEFELGIEKMFPHSFVNEMTNLYGFFDENFFISI
jgi:hypothetical protein